MNNLCMIGLKAGELEWVRLLVRLLRHRDPIAVELSKQILLYLEAHTRRSARSRRDGNADERGLTRIRQ